MLTSTTLLPLLPLLSLLTLTSAQSTPSQIASSSSFTSTDPHTIYPFPPLSLTRQFANTTNANSTAKTSRASRYIMGIGSESAGGWGVQRVQFGDGDLMFVPDPNNSTDGTTESNGDGTDEDLVLEVGYPAGSYSHGTGGTQFYSQPFNTSLPQSTLLTYSIYVPPSFNFVKGGKLPGVRGDAVGHSGGCSGGSETDGVGCFSLRLMWRTGGIGEVYAYIPITTSLCSQANVTCNSDYGTSLSRGSFTLQQGGWNDIALLVRLNDPDKANGIVTLWHNGNQVLSHEDIVIRTSSKLQSIGGPWISTFFGGDDSSWSTPTDQSLYFKDFQIWGDAAGSTASGSGYTYSGGNGSGNGSSGSTGGAMGRSGGWGMGLGLGVLGAVVGLVGLL